ncbi:MAG: beta-ketoacyl-[acyl-carrier-protein] synthase family protein [Nitrospirae bacterium]|nr:beta-ketoacyl-[acyl-carrier-protein] synthase family protein [Nitrospirota bacterium]
MKKRVVITGLGLATPLGLGLEENWQRALAGESGIRHIAYPWADKSLIRAAGELKESDYKRILEEFPEEAEAEGERRTLFALWAAKSALNDAGLLNNDVSIKDCGIIFAAGLGINRLEDIQIWTGTDGKFDYEKFGRECSMLHRESAMRNNSSRPSSLIAKRFGLHGPNSTITSACAAATQAIGIGFRTIRRGEADILIAGGADSMINPLGLITFLLLKAAAISSEPPEEICRPFDRKRAGLVMGEGAGIVVLEEESHAVKRGARIYGELAGYGTSMDAYQVTAPHPDGRGAEQSMRAALKDADLNPDEVDYINAHGTGTKLNDAAETLAIKKVFKDHAYNIPISSSKSMIGHLIAAAGGPEFVYTALSVNRDEIHPTINLTNPDPKFDLDYVPNIKRIKTVRAALSNSFGFGGQNATVVVKKYGII